MFNMFTRLHENMFVDKCNENSVLMYNGRTKTYKTFKYDKIQDIQEHEQPKTEEMQLVENKRYSFVYSGRKRYAKITSITADHIIAIETNKNGKEIYCVRRFLKNKI